MSSFCDVFPITAERCLSDFFFIFNHIQAHSLVPNVKYPPTKQEIGDPINFLTTVPHDGITTRIVITPIGDKAISSRQQSTHQNAMSDSTTHIIMEDPEHPDDHETRHHGPIQTDHGQEYHLHVHYVIFTNWWYLVALAIMEVVVYLITLLIIRLMNRTRCRKRGKHFCMEIMELMKYLKYVNRFF